MKIRFKRILACLMASAVCLGTVTVSGPVTAYASSDRQCQISGQSDWVGCYKAKDGSSLIIESVSESNVYLDYVASSEEGGGVDRDVLAFADEARTEAWSTTSSRKNGGIRYTLNRESVTVERSDENGVRNAVRYDRENGKYTWLTLQDGARYWMQGNGLVLKDGVTPDGWYVGSDGCWDPYMGMGPFQSGTYDNSSGSDTYCFRLREDLSREQWRLTDESDKRVVGMVDYYHTSDSGLEEGHRYDMRLINTMDGYVVVDTEGRIAAYLYPVGSSGQIMVRKPDAEGYESLVLRGNS